jgi:peptide-methionine (R)-S-oxide reductase
MKLLTDKEWRKKLTPDQYKILRQKGTETPFTGQFLKNKDSGMYVCAACGHPLFSSDTKFESGSGWPSFYDVAHRGAVTLQEDRSRGMSRIEVMCANCGGHLGHVFNDGPTALPDGRQAMGQRFCINSCSLDFQPKKK